MIQVADASWVGDHSISQLYETTRGGLRVTLVTGPDFILGETYEQEFCKNVGIDYDAVLKRRAANAEPLT